jgi:hypothetical protein
MNRIQRILWRMVGPLVIRVGRRILAETAATLFAEYEEMAAKYDGISKDVIAIRHRLSSIESTINVAYQAGGELRTAKDRVVAK